MKQLDAKHYRLWSYTKDVAEKLEEEGFSPDFYGYTVRDWLEDIGELIDESRFRGGNHFEMPDM